MSAPGEDKSASAQDFQRQGRAALRVVGRKAGENRWLRAFYRAGNTTVNEVGHVAHSLWLEVTGFLFVVLALIGGGATVREYQYYAAGKASSGKARGRSGVHRAVPVLRDRVVRALAADEQEKIEATPRYARLHAAPKPGG